jgi:hypothetical protein
MATKQVTTKIEISAPNFKSITVRIEGTAPLLLHKFSEKMRRQIEEKQTSKSAVQKKREPKDYAAEYNAARYISQHGWDGIPAGAIRASMIAACRTITGLPMTKAKGAFFILSDGRDGTDGTPLVKINGEPKHDTRPVRLESGVADMRNRPRYDDWSCDITIQFDADMLSAQDVANLLARAGAQVGIGELRPQGPNSYGGDLGTWSVQTSPEQRKEKPVVARKKANGARPENEVRV